MENLGALTLVSMVFIIIGLLLRYLTPGINRFYGYRTITSMASQENWDFSQKYSGRLLTLFGLALFLITIIVTYAEINLENNIGKGSVAILILSSVIIIIVLTEKAMKKNCNLSEK
jgi:uncharacterized membrane protein